MTGIGRPVIDSRHTQLHLVAPYRTRITERDHFADIIVNSDGNRLICFWIVQRYGSPDVLAWGQERSFEAGEQAAEEELARRSKERSKVS